MIRHVRDIRADEIPHADVAVVGAGFAGIDLTRSLARHGLEVVLLEAGDLDFDPKAQALTRIETIGKPIRVPDPESPFTPYLAPVYRGETRVRQFGGTSNIWTGKWRVFDAIDFEERPWIPHSGWPIASEDLSPWYEAIAEDFGLGRFDLHGNSNAISRLRTALAPAGLTVSFHYWEKSPTRLARRFREELEGAPGVTVLLGANVTELVLGDDLRRVDAAIVRSLEGHELRVTADRFVLATGGLETPRILLASNRQLPHGIGNAHDLLGRFYMDHPKHKRGILYPGPAWKLVGKEAISFPRPTFIASFSLADDVQRERALPNHAVYFQPRFHYERDYPGEQVQMIRDARVKGVAHALAPTLAILRSPRALLSLVQQTIFRRRTGRITHCTVSMYLEQVPNPESRVFLASSRDALGMPKLVVDWQLTQPERDAFERALGGLVDACSEAGLGRLEFGPLSLDDLVDAAHPMGTTRMAETPHEGVVDPDCKVFGTENLFVASGSVFPTGHTVGPTFTILALARRLGAHLVQLAESDRRGARASSSGRHSTAGTH
jgi:choline dehydrogenase-like flavoprotein